MINFRADQIGTIVGKRGEGKSYLLKKWVNASAKFVLYDTLSEHNIDGAIVAHNYNDFYNALRNGSKKIIYRPRLASPADFDAVCKCLYIVGNYTLFVDEAEQVMPNNQMQENAKIYVNHGRHRKCGMVCATRRCAAMDKLPISQSDHIIVFKTILPNDKDWLSEFVGPIIHRAWVTDKMGRDISTVKVADHGFLYNNGRTTVVHAPI